MLTDKTLEICSIFDHVFGAPGIGYSWSFPIVLQVLKFFSFLLQFLMLAAFEETKLQVVLLE